MEFQELFKFAMDRDLPNIKSGFSGGLILNLGCGTKKVIPNSIGLDLPAWDADSNPIPCKDESVSVIHAYHFFEHVKEPVKVLLECQRVLMPGGLLNICVPYYNSQMFAHDLDHKHAFCEETWRNLFSNPYYNKNRINWQFIIRFNLICGIVERNLCLITQLERK